MALLRRKRGRDEPASGRVDWLVVGLGNPGEKYARTRHNVGFEVAALAAERWGLPKAKKRYAGLYTDGRTGPGGPRVGVLLPQTYMNDAGRSAGPARGALRVDLDRVVAVHDEIDLPFGRIEARLGGGLAGHNGLKSLRPNWGARISTASAWGWGAPTPPTPRSCRPTCWAGSPSPRTRCASSSSARRTSWIGWSPGTKAPRRLG